MVDDNSGDVTKAPAGASLEEALRRWGDREVAREMDQLDREGYSGPLFFVLGAPPSEYEIKVFRYRELRSQLEKEIFEKLHSGQLTATGYDSRMPINAEPVTIPADRWRVLKPNYEESSAETSGFTVTGILVYEGKPKGSTEPRSKGGKHAPAALREWYLSWVKENVENGNIPTRAEDWAVAKGALGKGVPREAVRDLRRELAPERWRKQGRRKSAD